MIRSIAADLAPAAFLATALVLASVGARADVPAGSRALGAPDLENVEPVTVPDLSPFEPAVADQLRAAVSAAEEVLATSVDDVAVVAETFGELGKLFHAYELLDAARQAYGNAARLAPDDVVWLYYLGHANLLAGDLDAAIDAWKGVRSKVGSGHAALLTHLGRAHRARGDLDEARELLEAALTIDGDLHAARSTLGEIALEQGDAARAIVLLEAALDAVPAANRLHYPLALAYRKAGQAERARAHLAQRGGVGLGVEDPRLDALEALKSGERVFLLRGRRAFAVGRYGDAAEAFAKAAAADPESARARVNLGTALARAEQADDAIAAFRDALRIEPTNDVALANLGQLLLSRGDASGLEHLEQAAANGPGNGLNHRLYADALVRFGRLEEAVESYHEAAVWTPTDEAAIFGKASALVDLARFAEAHAWLDEANRRMPSSIRIAAALARLLAGSPDKALRDGARALDLARAVFAVTEQGEHARVIAQALGELGRCAEAAALQEEIVAALPEADGRRAAFIGELEAYRAGPPCRP